MAPPLTKDQLELLHNIYYDKNFFFGRDKLFKYIEANYPESDISRRQVMDFIKDQKIHQLYLPTKQSKEIKPTVLSKPYSQIAIDLIDYSGREYKGYKWILVGYDLFTKKIWAIPMKNKTPKTTKEAFKKMLKQMKQKPDSIRHDNGSEFKEDFKKFIEDSDIKQVFSSPQKPYSNGGVERANGILKNQLEQIRTQEDNPNWPKYIKDVTSNINNSISRITDETPNNLEDADEEKFKEVKERIKKSITDKNKDELKSDIKAGDKVRIKLKKDVKGGQNWSNQVYKVARVIKPKKSTVLGFQYKLVNPETKKPFSEIFYNHDLQKIKHVMNESKEPEKFTVSKLVKPMVRNINGKYTPYYEVKWKGYKEKTLEPRSTLIEDIPKIINKFEKEHNVKWFKTTVNWEK